MPAAAFALIWTGYSVTLYGYCLVKGYDVSFGQLVRPTSKLTWPPPKAGQSGSTG